MINIQKNVSLAGLTTFKVGGPAKFFVEVFSENDFFESIDYAKKNNLKIFVLGGGSNILVSDNGFDGLVIKIKNQKSNFEIISQNKKILLKNVWAGDNLPNLVRIATDNSLTGLEWAIGIPGTIGGAIYGNAGAYGNSMSDNLESVRVFDIENSELKTFKKEECNFSYRNSIFKKNKNLLVFSCELKFERGSSEEIENRIKDNLEKRNKKIPKELSAGSFFQNPKVDDSGIIKRFEKDCDLKCKNNTIPAGWLIERLGLRGKKIGGAMISEKHANFIINTGNATAEDVVMLVSFVKMKVRNRFKIQLKEEVQYVGF